VQEQPFHDVRVHFTRLDASGRIVLPREMREHLHMEAGDPIVVIEDENSCRIATAKQSLAEAQAYFADLVPPDVSLVDSLLAERRVEAARE
jgi:AbrB family looped-hinge helix DNA binding protein